MKKHVLATHEEGPKEKEEENVSPPRKTSKTDNLDSRIQTEANTEDVEEIDIDDDDTLEKKEAAVENAELKERLTAANRRMWLVEQENIKLVEQNKMEKARAEILVKDLEDFIQEHERNTKRIRDELKEIVLKKEAEIERIQTELEKYIIPKTTPIAEKVSKTSPTQTQNTTTADNLNQMPVNNQEESENFGDGAWLQVGGRLKCNICGVSRNNIHQMSRHMKLHDEDEEDGNSTCKYCQYQTTTIDLLMQHIERAHKSNNPCSSCEMTFNSEDELNMHIMEQHKFKSFKPCRAFPSHTCEYDGECRFNHIILKENERICYKCGKRTSNQNDLMKHMQDKHQGIICKKFQENKCSFGTRCMFSHTNVRKVERPHHETGVGRAHAEVQQDFREPPQGGGQNNIAVTREEVTNMNQMMAQMMSQLNIVMSKMGLGPQ